MMTLLYSDNDIGGLEVMHCTGRWVRVPVIDDAFTVNLGDLMMRWTRSEVKTIICRTVVSLAPSAEMARHSPKFPVIAA
jgi:isopenicillin N synthase-like dioxygenase